MKNINIIVMGKAGSGKSTLINSVLGENVAPTGIGQKITKENKVYSRHKMFSLEGNEKCQYRMLGCNLNMYDTVGLEIDNKITESTLKDIKKQIINIKFRMSEDDMHLVWFCINDRSSRFESYEINLIKKLSIDYEIPFIIVITQCFSNEEGKMEAYIRENLKDVSRCRILAEDYHSRAGVIHAFGVEDLFKMSVNNYKKLNVRVIEQKLFELDIRRQERIKIIEYKGNEIVSNYTSLATKIGFIPGGCILIIYGMCIKMIADLNNLTGLNFDGKFADEIFENVVVGIVAAPFMTIPLVSGFVAGAYIDTVGKSYMEALMNVIHLSSDMELEDNELTKKRLKEELLKLKK